MESSYTRELKIVLDAMRGFGLKNEGADRRGPGVDAAPAGGGFGAYSSFYPTRTFDSGLSRVGDDAQT